MKSSRAFPFVSWMKGGPVLLLAVLSVSRSQCPSDPDGVEQFMRDRTSGVEHPGVFFCQKPRPEMFQGGVRASPSATFFVLVCSSANSENNAKSLSGKLIWGKAGFIPASLF